ncbi:hypothetical protein RUM43_007195 [Polyplax serrata]|uniref:Uncharacterized protein n=1 Tax=Polyplax serrata TaxID=468196 RepID=A0AAN8S5B7_POLSC
MANALQLKRLQTQMCRKFLFTKVWKPFEKQNKMCFYRHLNIDAFDAAQTKERNLKKPSHFFEYRQYILENCHQTVYNKDVRVVFDASAHNPIIKQLTEIKYDFPQRPDLMKELQVYVQNELHVLSYDELLDVTSLIGTYVLHNRGTDIKAIKAALDQEYLNRRGNLTFQQTLKCIDVLVRCGKNNKFWFTLKSLSKYCTLLDKMDLKEALHVLFLLYCYKKVPGSDVKFSFQIAVNNLIQNINLHELGLVGYTLSKVNLKISHLDLIKNMVNKLLSNIEDIDSQTLECVSLALTKSSTRTALEPHVVKLQESFLSTVDKFNISSLACLSSVGLRSDILNKDLFERVLVKVKDNIHECTLYDLNMLLAVCATFNVEDKEFFNLALNLFLSNEHNIHPSIEFVRHLICLEIFDVESIKRIMSERSLSAAFKSKSYFAMRDTVFIDTTIDIEIPTYDGPRLDDKRKKKALKAVRGHDFIESSLQIHTTALSVIFEICKKLYGTEAVAWKKVLPCDHSVIIIRLNKCFNPEPIPTDFKMNKNLAFHPTIKGDHIWIGIVVHENKQDKMVQTVGRQLKILGYTPLMVPVSKLMISCKSKSANEYIEDLIKTELNQHSKLVQSYLQS